MNYLVDWPKETLDELAAAWLASADRDAVTAASHVLDRELAHDPYACGIPVGTPQSRTAAELPLGIDYIIIEDDKKVRVLRVWSVM